MYICLHVCVCIKTYFRNLVPSSTHLSREGSNSGLALHKVDNMFQIISLQVGQVTAVLTAVKGLRQEHGMFGVSLNDIVRSCLKKLKQVIPREQTELG